MRTRIILISLFIAALGAGCGSEAGGSGTKRGTARDVVAGFYPLAFVASEVGGRGVRVQDLTPPGAEPHDLEISPRAVSEVRSADLVLLLGHGFQPQLEDAAGSGDNVELLLDTPGLRRRDDDPHVWLDPARFARVAERVGELLERPAAGRALAERLRALDAELRSGLARCARRTLVTSHDAFRYLAQRYRLQEVPITGVSPEAEPTPGALDRVIDSVRRTRATTVFTEPLVSPRLAEAVARETGARTAVLNPVEALTAEERAAGKDYFDLMRANLSALRQGLGCR